MKARKSVAGSWRCPKCGREFAQRTGYHSCGNFTLEGYLAGKNPQGVALFNQLLQTVQGLGPVTLSPAKTQIGFKSGSTFMGVSIAGRQLTGYLLLPRAIPGPMFRRIATVSARRHVHHFRLADPALMAGLFAACVAEAIAVSSEASPAAPVKPGDEPPIGEQINAIFRQDRLAAPGAKLEPSTLFSRTTSD